MAPLITVLLILSVLVYILSSPLSFILQFFMDDTIKAAVEEFKAANDAVVELKIGTLEFNGDYPMPVSGEITSPYGYRIHPVTGEYKMHTGIDIRSEWRAPVKSIAYGRVVKVGIDDGYGQFVVIFHDAEEEPFYSVYAHLSKVYALQDQEVMQGSIIGLEGGDPELDPLPGRSTGHHLHFEIRKSMSAYSHVDPVTYLFETTEEEDASSGDEAVNFKIDESRGQME
jgi:murein DD-endopeptidase MepM/ murein hydrolase activator NlpD